MANEDGLVQLNISLSKSQLPLLPELMNVLTTARNSTYTWDSMKLCLQNTQSDETGSRLVLNVTKNISDEKELIVGRLHRCNDNVCTHNSSENILGDVKMTTFINESFREYLRKENLDAVNVNSPGWNSDEVFYPNWYDHIRRESMTPQDLLSDLSFKKTDIKRDSAEPIYFVNDFDGIPYVNHNAEHYGDDLVKTSGEESEEKTRLRRIFNRAKGPLSKPSLELVSTTFPKDDEKLMSTPFENEIRLNDDPKMRRNLLRLKETLDLPLSSDSEFNTVFVDNNRHYSLPQPVTPIDTRENIPSNNLFTIDCNYNHLKGRYSEYNCKKKPNAEIISRNQSNAELERINKAKRNIKGKFSTDKRRKSLMSYSASEISKRKIKESSELILKVGTSKSKHNLKPSSSPHKRSTRFRKRSTDVQAANNLNDPFSFVQKSKMISSINAMDSENTSLESNCSKRSLKTKKKKSKPGKWFYKKDINFEIEPLEPGKRKKKPASKDIINKNMCDKKIVQKGAERILSFLIGGTGQSNEKFDDKMIKLTALKDSRNSLTNKKEKELRFKDSELYKIRSENRKIHRERTPKKDVESALNVKSDEIKMEKSQKDLSKENKIKQNECDYKLMEKREEALTDKYLMIGKQKDPSKNPKSEKAYGDITRFWKKAFAQPKRAAVPGIPENAEATGIQTTTQKGTTPKKEISFLELLSVITEEVKHLGRRREKKIKDQN